MKLSKALAGIAGALALTAGTAFADDLRWKMPVAFATNLPGLGSPAAWVADTITRTPDTKPMPAMTPHPAARCCQRYTKGWRARWLGSI